LLPVPFRGAPPVDPEGLEVAFDLEEAGLVICKNCNKIVCLFKLKLTIKNLFYQGIFPNIR